MSNLLTLPIDERIQLVEDIWDSIAVDQSALQITEAQRQELDKRLDAFDEDSVIGREVSEVIARIKSRL
jgi:putative addiction module component (TIGR02574 family)